MRVSFILGVMAGSIVGMAAATAAAEAMHPGIMVRDGRKLMRKARRMMN